MKRNNNIYRINNKGNGFFVKIPYKSKLLPVLITANQVITTNDIQNNENISLKLYNDKKIKNNLFIIQKQYIFAELDIKEDDQNIRIINSYEQVTRENEYIKYKQNENEKEIKENEDNLNNNYLELNDDIFNYFKLDKKDRPKYLDILYNIESIYLLQHSNEKEIFVSYGKLLDKNNKEIIY